MNTTTDNRELARRVSSLYGRDWVAHYVSWKIRLDPVYEAVAERLRGSSQPLLDVGCGLGVLSIYLREAGFRAPIAGLDLDREKIDRAKKVASNAGHDISFEDRVVEEIDRIPGNVTMLDVVHYLEDGAQQTLLRSIAGKLRPGARLIMRETLADGSWRAKVTWLEEAFARATGWMRTSTINFPKLEEIEACFPRERFDRTVTPLWGRTPFNSYLLEYVCRDQKL